MTSAPTPEAIAQRQQLLKRFKIYGAILWAIFLVGAILVPSLMGFDDQEVKQIAGRSFVGLLVMYFLPYFITWKVFERKHGPLNQFSDNASEKD
jgi:membrane protease YdiL (CAAX protease family)